MKLDVKDILSKVQPALAFVKRYVRFIFFISTLIIAIFLVYRINQLSRLEPGEDVISEKLQTVQRPKLDPDVLQKVEQLQDQNIQVQALFDQARNNPFSE